MDSYASSSAAVAAASVYSPYMVHHHQSPSPTNATAPTIKPETAVTTAAALQSALNISTPMNVNLSMNFNSHNIQYSTGYHVPPATASSTSNLTYDSFYGPTRHPIPSSAYHHHHQHPHPSIPLEMKTRLDPVTSKQSMLLTAAANYDYKDLSKFREFFPTPSSSVGSTDRRRYDHFSCITNRTRFFLVHGYRINPYQNLRRIEITKDEPIDVVSVEKSMLDQVHSKLIYEHIQVKK